MSLESKIEALTSAVVALTEIMRNASVSLPVAAPAQMAASVPVAPVVAPVAAAPVPVAQFAQAPAIEVPASPVPFPAAPAPAMPALPSFAAPAPQAPAAPAALPFSDVNGLSKYAMEAFQVMGSPKGHGINDILLALGYENINHVQPHHFGEFYAKVEALKVS